MKKYIVFIIIVIAVIIASGWLYIKETNQPQAVQQTTSSANLPSEFGHNFKVLDLTITPIKVVQDSRCPVGVQCIQAGTVQLEATVVSPTGSTTQTFTIGMPVDIGLDKVTLTSVAPEKKAGVTINPSDYSFTFAVTKEQ